jgi:hypothetical protein
VINRKDTTYYCHLIDKFDFTARDGKEKWTAYKFTKNVYKIWMLIHLKRIYLVINELLADINFKVSKLPSSKASRLSQVFDDQKSLSVLGGKR